MAILKKQDENDNNGGAPPSPFLPNTSMPSNQTQAYTAPKKPASGAGGQFTNIQSYLNAANPEKQGQQSGGQQIQAGVQKAQEKNAESVREGIAKSQENFGNAYNPEKTRLDQGLNTVNNTLNAAQTNPSQLNQDQINQYRDYATGAGSYNQLNGLSNTPDTSGLESAAKMAGTEGGRYQLLNDTFKRPSYSSGQQKLDQLLLQTQSAAPLQKNLGDLARNVGTERTNAMDEATLKANALKDLAGGIKNQAVTGVTNAETGLEKSLNDKVTGLQSSADSAYNTFNKALSGQTLTPEESAASLKYAKDTGLDLNQGLYGIPGYQDFHPEQFLNHQQFNKQNVASPEERARADALSKLAGVENTYLPGQAPTDRPDLKNVFNSSGFKEATDKRKTEYESQYNPKKQELDALTEIRNAWNDPNTQTLADAVSKNAQYLDPSLVGRIVDSREFNDAKPHMGQGLPFIPGSDGGGMRAAREYLGDIFRGTWEPKYNQVNTDVNKLNTDYSQGQTLESLLRNGYKK